MEEDNDNGFDNLSSMDIVRWNSQLSCVKDKFFPEKKRI